VSTLAVMMIASIENGASLALLWSPFRTSSLRIRSLRHCDRPVSDMPYGHPGICRRRRPVEKLKLRGSLRPGLVACSLTPEQALGGVRRFESAL
jgi:hypothetical protein